MKREIPLPFSRFLAESIPSSERIEDEIVASDIRIWRAHREINDCRRWNRVRTRKRCGVSDIRYCSGAPVLCDENLTPGRPRASNVSLPALRMMFPSLLDQASGRNAPVLATCRSLLHPLIEPADKSTTNRTRND